MPGNATCDSPRQPDSGTDQNDVLRGTNRDDSINGGFGDDIIYARGGNDTVIGSRGDDTVYGGSGDDTILGDDPFFGGFGADTVFGGKGDDVIDVQQGEDVVDGGPGGDSIHVNSARVAVPFVFPDGEDIVLFEYAGHGKSFGHDTIHELQLEDVLVFLDKSGKTESLEDLAEQTRLVDVGEDSYRLEWLKSDQSVTLNFSDALIGPDDPPGPQPNVDDFTTLEELAEVVEFRFDYDFA